MKRIPLLRNIPWIGDLSLALVGFGLVFLVSFALAGWALNERFRQTNERRIQQAAFNDRIREISLNYCREIETLKSSRREEARASRRNLRRNLRLLGIPVTAEIRRAADANLEASLERFRASPCPRPQLTGGEG